MSWAFTVTVDGNETEHSYSTRANARKAKAQFASEPNTITTNPIKKDDIMNANTETFTTARELDLSDVVSSKTIAERAGVPSSGVANWVKQGKDFPAPLDIPGVSVPLFSWTEVEVWVNNKASNRADRKAAQKDKLARDLAKLEEKEARLKALAEKLAA